MRKRIVKSAAITCNKDKYMNEIDTNLLNIPVSDTDTDEDKDKFQTFDEMHAAADGFRMTY